MEVHLRAFPALLCRQTLSSPKALFSSYSPNNQIYEPWAHCIFAIFSKIPTRELLSPARPVNTHDQFRLLKGRQRKAPVVHNYQVY